MNQDQILPDDPRLTAYALDDMDPAERADFARMVESDPAARQAVAEIRSVGRTLAGALAEEAVAPDQSRNGRVAAIIPGDNFRTLDGGPLRAQGWRKLVRFPQLYFVVSGVAAACFALFFSLWQERHRAAEEGYARAEQEQQAALIRARREAVETAKEEDRQRHLYEVELQAEAAKTPAPAIARLDDTVELPKVVVAENETRGFTAANTLAGTRVGAVSPVMFTLDQNAGVYGFHSGDGFVQAENRPTSTFSADVDTESYASVRRHLLQGRRPAADTVRIEELVNYFPYHYPAPTGAAPLAASLEVAGAPWAPSHRLVRIGLRGPAAVAVPRLPANLVFLLEVLPATPEARPLPLVQRSLRLLVNKMRPGDRMAIVVYGGGKGLVLPSTEVARKAEILDAIDHLEAGGSTKGPTGIQLAYEVAKENFISGGTNRVILATAGDLDVGTATTAGLARLVEDRAKNGVTLSVLGFGMGERKDTALEQLAERGHGSLGFVTSLTAAKKLLIEQAGGTLATIAREVKLQVVFNPATVHSYRLLGYETPAGVTNETNRGPMEASDVGADQTITALYEVVPAGAVPATDEHDAKPAKRDGLPGAELLTLRVQYKDPADDAGKTLAFVLRDTGGRFEDASTDFKFAAAVAAFGMALQDSPHKGTLTLAKVAEWGREGIAEDAGGSRADFLSLVERAEKVVQ